MAPGILTQTMPSTKTPEVPFLCHGICLQEFEKKKSYIIQDIKVTFGINEKFDNGWVVP